jgi:glc operon protein GlcG
MSKGGTNLTASICQLMITESHAMANEIGVQISTAIVDSEGRLNAFSRMDQANWLSVEVSQAKAFTGALLRRDGPDLQKMDSRVFLALAGVYGRGLLQAASISVVISDGSLVASIGCSGATDDQDGQCARAARDAYFER